MHWQRCVEVKSLVVDFRFICLGFIGPGKSLGDRRKAVSRMAAPRSLVVDHRCHFLEGVVPDPSDEA